MLVDHFLQKNIPFLSISKIIMAIMNDKNYKKYAIKRPKNINQIKSIDHWARENTLRKLKKLNEYFTQIFNFIFHLIFCFQCRNYKKN